MFPFFASILFNTDQTKWLSLHYHRLLPTPFFNYMGERGRLRQAIQEVAELGGTSA